MNVNELRTKLTNIQIRFDDETDRVLFSNAEIYCRVEGDINIVDVVEYEKEQNIVVLY